MSDFDDQPKKVFDAQAATEKIPALAEGLLAMLKAKQAAKHSETTRAFAVKMVQALEPTIIQLFEAGFVANEVLAQLAPSFPDVPVGDLRYAVKLMCDRNKHQFKIPKTLDAPVAERKKQTSSRLASDAKPVQPPPVPDSENDRMAHESDEDYAMRKKLEAISSTSSRKKFIGEN